MCGRKKYVGKLTVCFCVSVCLISQQRFISVVNFLSIMLFLSLNRSMGASELTNHIVWRRPARVIDVTSNSSSSSSLARQSTDCFHFDRKRLESSTHPNCLFWSEMNAFWFDKEDKKRGPFTFKTESNRGRKRDWKETGTGAELWTT